MSQEQFWGSTNEELSIDFAGDRQREDRWFEMLLFVGWRIAYWTRVDKFPSWESVKPVKQSEQAEQPVQPWQELKAKFVALAKTSKKGRLKKIRG